MSKNMQFWGAVSLIIIVIGYFYISENRINVDCKVVADNSLSKFNLSNDDKYISNAVIDSCKRGIALAKAGGTKEMAAAEAIKFVEDKISGERSNGAKFTAFLEGYQQESSFH